MDTVHFSRFYCTETVIRTHPKIFFKIVFLEPLLQTFHERQLVCFLKLMIMFLEISCPKNVAFAVTQKLKMKG